jgi:tetratricopeptide (TPR) repeat protein
MSLLLDARKKSQQMNSAQTGDPGPELSLEPLSDPATRSAAVQSSASSSDSSARTVGQKLFDAKSHVPSSAFSGINRNLLIFLGGTIVLLAAGAGYVWYVISSGNTQRPVVTPVIATLEKPLTGTNQQQNNLVPDVAQLKPAVIPKHPHTTKPSVKAQETHKDNPMLIEQHQEEPIDPILNSAYLDYRSGKFDQAQQQYRRALSIDSNNTDALLGLAAIAQHRGEDNLASHYYVKVLALDPRNAVANAGVSALSNDNNRESRLKTLLDEQQDSSSLHFALGNYYAEQSRWSEAQQAYFNAYKLAPGNAELAYNLAISLDRLGQNKSAVLYYQSALSLDPNQSADFDHKQVSQRIEKLTH